MFMYLVIVQTTLGKIIPSPMCMSNVVLGEDANWLEPLPTVRTGTPKSIPLASSCCSCSSLVNILGFCSLAMLSGLLLSLFPVLAHFFASPATMCSWSLLCWPHNERQRCDAPFSFLSPLAYNIALTTKRFLVLLKSPLFEGRHQSILFTSLFPGHFLAHSKFNNICSVNVPSPTQRLAREYLDDNPVFKNVLSCELLV